MKRSWDTVSCGGAVLEALGVSSGARSAHTWHQTTGPYELPQTISHMQRDPVLQGSGETGLVVLKQAIQGTLGGQLHHQHARANPGGQQRHQAGVVEMAQHHQLLQKGSSFRRTPASAPPSTSFPKDIGTWAGFPLDDCRQAFHFFLEILQFPHTQKK